MHQTRAHAARVGTGPPPLPAEATDAATMIYANVAILGLALLFYSAIAGRIERSWASTPIVFVALGLALGPSGFDLARFPISQEHLKAMAELTLAMVLFADAAQANLTVIRRNWQLPGRLLLLGLPLTIILGGVAAWALFPALAMLEIAILATMLAPTDAALGAPVVSNTRVPAPIRESLSFESGLNDGICVPILVILLGYATGLQVSHGEAAHVTLVVAEEIGIGALVGLAVTLAGMRAMMLSHRLGWIGEAWRDIPVLAAALSCFAVAQALGGSGFIACFVGGLLLSTRREQALPLLHGAETLGRLMSILTWVAFGWGVIPYLLRHLDATAVLYGLLSLTVIRMLPVYLCLAGTETRPVDRLFIGWFGPRGLASVVFAIIVLEAHLPGNDRLMTVAGVTVTLSVLLHGISATPLAGRLAAGDASPRQA